MTQLIWFIPRNDKPSNSGWVDFTRTRANQGTVDDALNEIITEPSMKATQYATCAFQSMRSAQSSFTS